MRFRIVQCLCPERHAIMAMPLQDNGMPDAQALEFLQLIVDYMVKGRGAELDLASLGLPTTMDPWCALCGAKPSTWLYELGFTREFPSWDAAVRQLRENEREQGITRDLLFLLDLSYTARLLKGEET